MDVDTFLTTLNKTNAILAHVETGRGTIGRLVYDDEYGKQVTAIFLGGLAAERSASPSGRGRAERG